MNLSPNKFELVKRWGLLLAGVFFCLVPRHARSSGWGEWYVLGWPVPHLALKVGYQDPQHPRGLHWHTHEASVFFVDAAIWFVLLYGTHYLAQKGFLSRRVELAIAVLAVTIGYTWFILGALSVASEWFSQTF
jgi:hypothetical protein